MLVRDKYRIQVIRRLADLRQALLDLPEAETRIHQHAHAAGRHQGGVALAAAAQDADA